MLTKERVGRHSPFFQNYRPQFYFRTTDVTGQITLPEGTEMVMPGDNIAMNVELIKPIAMDEGLASPSVRVAAPSAPAGSSRSSPRTPIEPDFGAGKRAPGDVTDLDPRDSRGRGWRRARSG